MGERPSGEVCFLFTDVPVDEVLLGHPILAVAASLDAPEAHFYVELLDVGADGGERLGNDGFLAASHRRSHSDPVAVVVGRPTDYRISIRPAHHRFRAGGRVRVRLSGGRPSALTAAHPGDGVDRVRPRRAPVARLRSGA